MGQRHADVTIGDILGNGDQCLPSGIRPNDRIRATVTLSDRVKRISYVDMKGKQRFIPLGQAFPCSWRKGSPWQIDIYGLPDAGIVSMDSRKLPALALSLNTTQRGKRKATYLNDDEKESAYMNRLGLNRSDQLKEFSTYFLSLMLCPPGHYYLLEEC